MEDLSTKTFQELQDILMQELMEKYSPEDAKNYLIRSIDWVRTEAHYDKIFELTCNYSVKAKQFMKAPSFELWDETIRIYKELKELIPESDGRMKHVNKIFALMEKMENRNQE